MAYSTVAKYEGDGGWQWIIPFPYANPSDVAVKIIDRGGIETRLALGADFQIAEQKVIRTVPAGQQIVIWLEADLASAQKASGIRMANFALRSAPDIATASLTETTSEPTQTAACEADSARIAELSARLAELEKNNDAALAAAQAAAKDAQLQAIAQAGEDQAQAVRQAALDFKIQIDTAVEDALTKIADQQDTLTQLTSGLQQEIDNAKTRAFAASESAETAQNSLAAYSARAASTVSNSAGDAVSGIQDARDHALADIRASSNQAQKQLDTLAALGSSAVNATGTLVLGEDAAKYTSLTLPTGLCYFPQRQMLLVYCNGTFLTPGVDYKEQGTLDRLSDTIQLLHFYAAGSRFSFWIVASNISAAAEKSAKEASDSAKAAGKSEKAAAENSRDAAKNAQIAQSSAGNTQSLYTQAREQLDNFLAQLGKKTCIWMHSGEDIVSQIYCLAEWAHHAAQWVSLNNAQPGISTVRDLHELDHAVSGFYIINPKLTHGPTTFLGLNPVPDLDSIPDLDGFYIIAPSFGDDARIPGNPIPKPHGHFPDFSEILEWLHPDWHIPDTGGSTTPGNAQEWLPGKCAICMTQGGKSDA